MTDHIKSSQVIQGFLEKEKIKIKLDKYSLVIAQPPSFREPDVVTYDDVDDSGIMKDEMLAPFYGPGGADNSLKALQGWLDKKWEEGNPYNLRRVDLSDDVEEGEPRIQYTLAPRYSNDIDGPDGPTFEATGHSDGIALHDLLEKLMEEKSNAKV